MANPNRKLAMMKKIDAITPIEGADRIETAHIGGWTCVVGRDTFKPDELCVYIEPDAFLPTDDERYAEFAERGEKLMDCNGRQRKGHVLRTIRLRGQISQGLVLKPEDALPESIPSYVYRKLYENKVGLNELCNVWEYRPEQNSLAAGFIGKYSSRIMPRSDAERVQNIDQEVFDLIKRTEYFASVKVDGTSITLVNDSMTGKVRAFSHNNEFSLGKGQGKLVMETARKQGLDVFLDENPDIAIQAELCGPKIEGNTLKLKEYRLFVFSMWDVNEHRYLNPYDTYNHFVAESVTPRLDIDLNDFATPHDLIEWTSSMRGNVTNDTLDEGVVIHVVDTAGLTPDEQAKLRNALGEQMQMKSVSAAFLLKKAKRG